MLIGIDASRAISDAPTGTENYSREIIAAMLQLDSAHSFRLYTRSTPPPELFPPTRNYETRAIPFPRLWTHARLSAEMLTRSPEALFVPAHVLPLIHPPRSVATVHDLGYLHFPQAHRAPARMYLDLSTRWNVRAARRVVADSNATREDLIRFYGVPSDKIHVVYPAINTHRIHRVSDADEIARVRARHGIAEAYLIAVGVLQPRKNLFRLIEAFSKLGDEYQLVIVGRKGWLYESIFAKVEELQLLPRVKFLDYVPLDDLLALYSGARLCVYPSLYEGFGFPVLEAQACGAPVACSNTSSLPEVGGDAVEYFDPSDVQAIRDTLARLLRDPARREDLVRRGHLNLQRFSWTRAAKAVLEIITAP